MDPDQYQMFTDFFHQYLLPNQLRHGAKLVGRWVNEDYTEVMAMWEYKNRKHFEEIDDKIRRSDLHKRAQEKRQELGGFNFNSREEFMTSTAGPEGYHLPKHLVGVAGYITNEKGEVLLVRNLHRSYTAEIPGGLLEEGEKLIEGVKREILEETGVEVKINGLSTVNQNLSSGNISVVFNGEYVSGELTPQEGETSEVFFEKLGEHNIDEFITATQLKDRTLDAMKEQFVPHQTYRSRPEYQRITRLEGKGS